MTPVEPKPDFSTLFSECQGMLSQYMLQIVKTDEGDLRTELEEIGRSNDLEKLKKFHQRMVNLTNPHISEPSSGYR